MMRKTIERIRNLWLETQLVAPPWLQHAAIEPLHQARRAARLLARPYLPIVQWLGESQGGPLNVAFSGCDDAEPFFKDLLFTAPPVEKALGRIPIWQADRLTALPADLVIVEADRHLVRRFARQGTWVMPPRVEFRLNVQGDWRDVELRISSSVRRHEFRLVRKYGYDYAISHSSQDLETFYAEMYWPTVTQKHGELAAPVSLSEAHLYFKHGCLLRIERDGDWVASGVCRPQRGTVNFKLLGVKNADRQLIHEGAQAAVYYAAIHWANQAGFESINMEGCRSYLGGLFQFKRKWGTSICLPAHQYCLIWIKVQRLTSAVCQFLQDNPCIVTDAQGKLYALVVIASPDDMTPELETECRKRYMTPGLSGLLIRPVTQLFAAQAAEKSVQ